MYLFFNLLIFAFFCRSQSLSSHGLESGNALNNNFNNFSVSHPSPWYDNKQFGKRLKNFWNMKRT